MSILQAIVLGLVQGATEFIPVSSSGHLVLIPWLLGWRDPGLTYDAIVHLGTVAAVLITMRREVLALLAGWWASLRRHKIETSEARLAWLLIVSALPGALLGVLLGDFLERLFGSPPVVSLLLLLTGTLLVVGERLGRREATVEEMSVGDALLMGLAQGCAIAPGISRSGATISTGLLRGLAREEATRFSFLMAIPIIVGAAGVRLLKIVVDAPLTSAEYVAVDGAHLLVGFLTAFLSGLVAIRFLLNHVRRYSLRPFTYYCWAIGLFGLVISWVR